MEIKLSWSEFVCHVEGPGLDLCHLWGLKRERKKDREEQRKGRLNRRKEVKEGRGKREEAGRGEGKNDTVILNTLFL